ncbi:DUF4062 domain-containing protein [Vibrio crassostreae]|uniref:DUF4062 domain-containing protein n=1 Tax=Vibrio splendidus TaxID=29497 RepID=UPI002468C781|nr:DUF4062 domain-containing protein [Vibrio splendidus]CAK2822212.1 DUF4062 domain-containing protein [Vibrio crassostreae]MDH5937973.1 DUF4062 domain-containing protein [Vibrio splendidus]CAK2822467.1 DUF4062 domain-containing protein [Vibrio crassostreae]CAK2826843.1 DUF4062 domain-containing protein [Vibrio crassostreae]CAK2828616.1 DUF4062 domain-containing protein [Vibrio crassostreae]
MAIPKVFVSSTCYDLQEERAQLERFITSYGFQPVLSEYSGVFYNPDIHTHEACIKEVEHCDIFVLLIAGRFGGKLKDGEGESITQAEYNRARELKLPIFSFAKASINDAQHCYKKNLSDNGEEFANRITYPAIPKPSDAIPIFKFMDSVHRSDKNNGIETYQSFNDIENHLKKQLAGMFFSFLQKRKEEDKVEAMASILNKLAGSSSKLEALVGSLHDKEVGEDKTKEVLSESLALQHSIKFHATILDVLGHKIDVIDNTGTKEFNRVELSLTPTQLTESASISANGDLYKYLADNPLFSRASLDDDGDIQLQYVNDQTLNYFEKDEIGTLEIHYEQGIKRANTHLKLQALYEVYGPYLIKEKD